MKLTLHEIARNCWLKMSQPMKMFAINREFDSRKIFSGRPLLPLKGARDGHDFIKQP